MSNTPEGDDLSISGSDRFARMEHMLERILDELRAKADVATVVELQQRVRDLELYGSSQARKAQADLRAMHKTVERISGRVAWAGGAIAASVFLVNFGIYFIVHN